MKRTTKKFTQHRDALSKDLRNIKNAFSDTATDVTDMVDDMYDETLDRVKNQTSDLQKQVTEYTVQNPMHALGYALLAGFVIGCWWKK